MKLHILFAVAVLVLISSTNVSAQSKRESAIEQFKSGKTEQAIKSFEKLVKENPLDGQVWNLLGQSYLKMGNGKKAIESFQKAIKAEPDKSVYYSNLAFTYIKSKRFEKAEKDLEKAIELDPKNADAFYLLGLVYFNDKKFEKSLEQTETVILLDATYSAAYELKAKLLLVKFSANWENQTTPENIGLVSEAIKTLESCVEDCKQRNSSGSIDETLVGVKEVYDYLVKRKAVDSKEENSALTDQTSVKIIEKKEPRYSPEALKAGVSGEVDLAILFGANGKIEFVLVISGLSHGLTDQAIAAAKGIKFNPAMVNGKPISVMKMFRYRFQTY